MVSKWLKTNICQWGLCWGYNPLILTFDPDFLHIQVGMFQEQPKQCTKCQLFQKVVSLAHVSFFPWNLFQEAGKQIGHYQAKLFTKPNSCLVHCNSAMLLMVQNSGKHQLRLVVVSHCKFIYRFFFVAGGAGFLPSTVLLKFTLPWTLP